MTQSIDHRIRLIGTAITTCCPILVKLTHDRAALLLVETARIE